MDRRKHPYHRVREERAETRLLDEVVVPLEAIIDDDVRCPATPHIVQRQDLARACIFRRNALANSVHFPLDRRCVQGNLALREERMDGSAAQAVETVAGGCERGCGAVEHVLAALQLIDWPGGVEHIVEFRVLDV